MAPRSTSLRSGQSFEPDDRVPWAQVFARNAACLEARILHCSRLTRSAFNGLSPTGAAVPALWTKTGPRLAWAPRLPNRFWAALAIECMLNPDQLGDRASNGLMAQPTPTPSRAQAP